MRELTSALKKKEKKKKAQAGTDLSNLALKNPATREKGHRHHHQTAYKVTVIHHRRNPTQCPLHVSPDVLQSYRDTPP